MLRTRKARWTLAVITAVAVIAGGGAVAYAAVSATATTNTIGAGGYVATTADRAGFTDNQEVLNADQYALTVAGGQQGINLCNSVTNEKAAIGEFSNNLNTDYAVQYGVGVAPGCPVGQLTGLNTFPGLSGVPFGHHVWINESLVTRVKKIVILVCILQDHNNKVVPTPTPSVEAPAVTPSPSASVSASTSPSASPSVSAAAPTASTSPSASPSPSPSESLSVAAQVTSPAPDVTEPAALPDNQLPFLKFKCFIITKRITKQVVLFEAQDLDAPVAVPVAGDLAGVQTAVVKVPKGTVFDTSSWGASENVTAMVACAGAGFPLALPGPAAYTSDACQPAHTAEYATATVGGGTAQDIAALTSTELVSPNTTAALIAPNNTLSTTNTGPHGTSSDASVTGSHFGLFLGNAPVS